MEDVYKDCEVIGTDANGALLCWDAALGAPYNCGENLAEFGPHNLTAAEARRLGLADEIDRAYYMDTIGG